MKTATVTVELPDNNALALAQLCKRIGWGDCRSNAVNDDEAYVTMDAIVKLQRALADAGYSPR